MKYANEIGYSDIRPHEVVKVISDKTIEIRAMNAELDPNWKPEFVSGGFAGHCVNQSSQKWIITSDPEADVFRIRYSKRHSYVVRRGSNNFEPTEVRCFADAGGNKYKLSDEPRNFYDYNF